MRKELKYIIWGHVAVIAFLAYCSLDLICLIFDSPKAAAFTPLELAAGAADITTHQQHSSHDPSTATSTPLIPKIIHQTYKDENVPEKWREGQQACIDLHPDYQYILWTDSSAREFIEREYSWFLDTWDSYPYPIQRADAIRYFVLAHYGGIYIDLDDGCTRRLDPLLVAPAFVRETIPTGVSNDVMGSVPGHPFFLKVIDNLQKYKRNWLVPYITIMFSTGPLFVSVMLVQYKRKVATDMSQVRVLLSGDYKANPASFFSIAPGSSWHLDDAKFIKSLANHIGLAVFCGFALAALVFTLEWYLYQWCIHTNFSKIGERLLFKWNLTSDQRRRTRKDSNLPYAVDYEKLEEA